MARRRKPRQENLSRIVENNFNVNDYAKSMIDSKQSLRGSSASLRGVNNDRISTMLDNVGQNFDQIGSMVENIVQKDGLVRGVLNYLSTSVTLNHNIYPSYDPKKEPNIDIDKSEYLTIASELEKYNLKFFVPYFIYRTLIKGVSFYYQLNDSSGVAYLEFPNNMCRISYIENGVYRWMIDTSKIKSELFDNPVFPQEIKKAMESDDKSDSKKWVDGKYLLLSDKAIAFTFDLGSLVQGGVAVSELVSMLPGAITASKLKGNIDIRDNLDTVRIIHGKIPTDKEGLIKMSSTDAMMWGEMIRAGLPDGVAPIVTPFDLESVSLHGAGTSKAFDNVKEAQRQMLQSVGSSPQMFGDDTKSSNAIKLGITRDMAWIYKKILPVFVNYYNYVLGKMKTESSTKWRIRILEQNYFTLDDDIRAFKEAVTMGGSRTDYLASIGMTPLEIYTKLYMEQSVLDIDSIMKPKAMSYTMSGKDSSEKVGRPSTNNPTDDTERLADAD